jgi:hypothetical protein
MFSQQLVKKILSGPHHILIADGYTLGVVCFTRAKNYSKRGAKILKVLAKKQGRTRRVQKEMILEVCRSRLSRNRIDG